MLYEQQKYPHAPRVEDIAQALTRDPVLGMTYSSSVELLERMLDEGSRFANLERVLGRGAVFLLCHSGSDAL